MTTDKEMKHNNYYQTKKPQKLKKKKKLHETPLMELIQQV